ncbi:hypothetical protein [Sphingobium sp. CFD-2]|uniref:hypothetical protein n=1 Tax=Sphingobium sp. CFD-2 TaxID=2878542 RepID=UPI0011AEDB9B|nr:hypothetical protein [Sphingobium sp. CFD-2]
MILTYGQLEATLAGHLRIHPDRLGTLRARIKQLQKLQFPPGVNVGRGTKMAYSGAHLFQLVSAFELINLGLPAATATGLVTPSWRVIAAGYALAVANPSWGRPNDIFIRLLNSSLEDLTGGLDRHGWTSRAYIHDRKSLIDDLYCDYRRPEFSSILINASDVVRSVLQFAEQFARVPSPLADDEIRSWTVNYSDADYWVRVDETWREAENTF